MKSTLTSFICILCWTLVLTEVKREYQIDDYELRNSPQKYWWQRVTATTQWWSPKCYKQRVSDLIVMVDELNNRGIKMFTLNAMYDSGDGYDVSDMWCGLAGSNYVQLDPSLGSTNEWLELVDKVHSYNMTVLMWFNPSYIWTGSQYFKEAENDMKQCGGQYSCLSPNSKARWFKWDSSKYTDNKPSDSKPLRDAMTPKYFWDSDADASYLSYWAGQPSVNFESVEWTTYLGSVLKYWMTDMQLDGFVFDYPDGYVSAGCDSHSLWNYNPDLIKRAITDVVRSFNKAAFGEIYSAPERVLQYGFDAYIADDAASTLTLNLNAAITNRDANGIETVLASEGGSDVVVAECYFTGWCATGFMNHVGMYSWLVDKPHQYNCYSGHGAIYSPPSSGTMSLQSCFELCSGDANCDGITVGWKGNGNVDCFKRGGFNLDSCDETNGYYATFAKDAVSKSLQSIAILAFSGLSIAMDDMMVKTCWPGSDDPALNQILGAVEVDTATTLLALRTRLPALAMDGSQENYVYAMLRYNAQFGGRAAIGVFNLADTIVDVHIDLSHLPLKNNLGQFFINLLDNDAPKQRTTISNVVTFSLQPFGYELLGGLQFEEWVPTRRNGVNRNCYEGAGATYSPASSGYTSIASCFLLCESESYCDGVTVSNEKGGQVDCYLRGGIDVTQCVQSNDFSTYLINYHIEEEM